jgi:hypothetical protein
MRRLAFLSALLLPFAGACYSNQPLASTTPAPGTRLALAITDSGRVALGGSMGPEIRRVEGRLIDRQEKDYVLSVTGVDYLNGTFQKWAGETVTIKSNLVSGLYERRFSTGRTITFVVMAAAAAAVMRPRWIKSAIDSSEEPPPPGSETLIRPRGIFRLTFPR